MQLNSGTAPDGYADHALQVHGYTNNTPVVTLVLYEYETPYPIFHAFTTGSLIGKVSNVAEPYSGFTTGGGVQDTNAAGARGLYDGTNYGIEVKIPVDWFGSTYGGSIQDDGSGPNLIASVTMFSNTGALGSVGTVKDVINDGDGKTVMTETDVYDGESTFSTVTWKSYDESSHTPPEIDSFTDYSTQNIVYMFGVGFDPSTAYRVIFWDANGDNVEIEDTSSDSDGYLSAQHTFATGDDAGSWHCTVYTAGASPSGWNDYTDMVADDTSYTGDTAFYLAETAIPEIPTIMAGIAVAGLSFAIYYWMRKRKLARAQT